jgi:S-sulfo-L-cysteine synthase (3-phospho-L-serine-dependent)
MSQHRRRQIIFVESNTTGTGELFIRSARTLGFAPVLVVSDPGRYGFVTESETEHIVADTQSTGDILAAVRRADRGEIAGVYSSSDYFVETASEVAYALGLPGPEPAAIRRCRNKIDQITILQKNGLKVPLFATAHSTGELLSAAERIPKPLVVKPAFGSGSCGVRLCCSESDAVVHGSDLLRRRANERGLQFPPGVLLEEYIPGPEYSVEAFGGAAIGVTRKHLGEVPAFVEIGHDFPAVLEEAQERQIKDASARALSVLGLGWGPAHVELRYYERQPYIMEVNPRLAGGYIPELVRRSIGIDLIAETLKLATGRDVSLDRRMNGHASIRFVVTVSDGVIAEVCGVGDAMGISGVVEVVSYVNKESYVEVHGDFRDRVGHVLSVAGSAKEAEASANAGLSKLCIRMQPKVVEWHDCK